MPGMGALILRAIHPMIESPVHVAVVLYHPSIEEIEELDVVRVEVPPAPGAGVRAGADHCVVDHAARQAPREPVAELFPELPPQDHDPLAPAELDLHSHHLP